MSLNQIILHVNRQKKTTSKVGSKYFKNLCVEDFFKHVFKLFLSADLVLIGTSYRKEGFSEWKKCLIIKDFQQRNGFKKCWASLMVKFLAFVLKVLDFCISTKWLFQTTIHATLLLETPWLFIDIRIKWELLSPFSRGTHVVWPMRTCLCCFLSSPIFLSKSDYFAGKAVDKTKISDLKLLTYLWEKKDKN